MEKQITDIKQVIFDEYSVGWTRSIWEVRAYNMHQIRMYCLNVKSIGKDASPGIIRDPCDNDKTEYRYPAHMPDVYNYITKHRYYEEGEDDDE